MHLGDNDLEQVVDNEKDNNSSGPAVLIIQVEKKYIDNPTKLKSEFDNLIPNVKVAQVKTTQINNLIITFFEESDLKTFMDNKFMVYL